MANVLVLLGALAATWASLSPDVKFIVALFEARYLGARTLQVTFLENYSEDGKLLHSESGIAYFRRAGKMRWQYESPEKNLFLVDGKTAWFYVSSDHTVTRVPAKKSSDWRTPLALLAGGMKLSRVCKKVEPAVQEKPEAPQDAVLNCMLHEPEAAPREPASPGMASQADAVANTVVIEVERESGVLVRVLAREPGGVAIEFRFANWQYNPQLADSLFRFSVPPGVAIVNGEIGPGPSGVNP